MAENDNTIVKGQETTEKPRKDEEFLDKLRKVIKGEENARIKEEVLWYEIQLYLDGDHYVLIPDKDRSSASSLKVTPIQKRKGEIRRTYNKIRPLFRAIKATTTATDVRWEVQGGDENEILASNYLNWFIDVDKARPFTEVVTEVVGNGFARRTGWFDVYWDSQRAMPAVASRDPFDLVIDRYRKYARRTYTMRKEDVKNAKAGNDFIFKNTEKLASTSRKSASDIYDNYLNKKYNSTGFNDKDDDLSDVMMEEFHILEQKDDGSFLVRVVTTSKDSTVIHREDEYEDNELRFIEFSPEKGSKEPWMKDALDPQKSMDNIYSHMEEFIRTMGKGRVMKRKGVILDRISDKDGQVVEYDGIEKPEFMAGLPISGDQFNFEKQIEFAMEDLVGIHPSQVRNTTTAKGIGYLLAQDETNTSEPSKNLKNSLVRVGHRLLKLANRHMMSSQDIFWFQDGQKMSASVISPNADNKPEGTKEIKVPDSLTVDLVPRGAFAALAREEKVMQLVQNGIITNPEVAMEGMNIGNVRKLVEKEKQFRKENPPVQPKVPGTPGSPQGSGAMEQTDLRSVVEDLKSSIGNQ